MIRLTRINAIKCDNEAIKPESTNLKKYLRKRKMNVGLKKGNRKGKIEEGKHEK